MQSSLAKSNKFHSGKIKDYSNNMSIKDCTTFSTYGPFIHSLTALLLGLLVKFIAIEKAPQLFSGGGSRFMEFYFHPFSPSFFPSLSSPILSPFPPTGEILLCKMSPSLIRILCSDDSVWLYLLSAARLSASGLTLSAFVFLSKNTPSCIAFCEYSMRPRTGNFLHSAWQTVF